LEQYEKAVVKRGFILTPTYRVVAGRPEVHLHSILDDGKPALIVDDRLVPYFFVRTSDATVVAGAMPNLRLVPTELRDFAGEKVSRVETALPQDVPPLRGRLADAGVDCLEADLRFAYRYLIDRGIRGAFTVDGPYERRPGVGRVYRNCALMPADFTPSLRVLSLDVETSPDGKRLYSIAMAGAGGERVLLVGSAPVEGAEVVPDEYTLLERFIAHVRRVDPDVLTGWNVCDFDLNVLLRACRQAGIRCALGRTDDELDVRQDQSFTRESRAVLCGRQVLDGLALVRSAFIRLDDYRLETAGPGAPRQGQAVLGPAPRRADRGRVPQRPRRARRLQPAGRAPRAGDPGADGPRRARGAAEPADRHADRPRERAGRVGRLALPGRAARGAAASRRRCAGWTTGGARRSPGAWCSTRGPGSTATSSSSTSRACTRASSAPSTSTR
jgi:hypothetical protein